MNTLSRPKSWVGLAILLMSLSGCGPSPDKPLAAKSELAVQAPWAKQTRQDPAVGDQALQNFEAIAEPGARIQALGKSVNGLARKDPEMVIEIYTRAINRDLQQEASQGATVNAAGNLELSISAKSWNHVRSSLGQLAHLHPEVAAAVIDRTDDEFRSALAESTTNAILTDPYSLALYVRAMQDSDLAKGVGWQVAEHLIDSQGEVHARLKLPAYEEILHVPSQAMIDRILTRRLAEYSRPPASGSISTP